jgi:hypothetical protein
MLVIDLARQIWDNSAMSEEELDPILWGCTGWPEFWTGNPVRCLTRQLQHARRAIKRGYTIDQISEGSDRECRIGN